MMCAHSPTICAKCGAPDSCVCADSSVWDANVRDAQSLANVSGRAVALCFLNKRFYSYPADYCPEEVIIIIVEPES